MVITSKDFMVPEEDWMLTERQKAGPLPLDLAQRNLVGILGAKMAMTCEYDLTIEYRLASEPRFLWRKVH